MRIHLTVAASLLSGVVMAQQGVPPPTVPPPTVPPPTPPTTSPPATSPPVMSPIMKPYPTGPSTPGMPVPVDFAVVVGRVVDHQGRGVARAKVRIVNQTHLDSVLTDSHGRFFFRSVSPGDALVLASKQGYLDGGYGQRRASGQPQPITLAAGQTFADMRIELFRTASVTGIVTDEGGDPIVNARVVAYMREFGKGPWEYREAGTATTDDTGAYRLHGLRAGQYIVSVPTTVLSAAADEYGAVNLPVGDGEQMTLVGLPTVTLKSGANKKEERFAVYGGPTPPRDDGSEGVYQTLYFTGTEYRPLAMPINLAIGETRYAVHFRLALVPAFAVRGRITGPEGSVGRQAVRLIPIGADYGAGHEAAITMANEDGTFVFPRVPRGEYRLETNSGDIVMGTPSGKVEVLDEDARPARRFYWARVPVNVVAEDVVVPEVQLRRGAWVAVSYQFDAGGGAVDAYSGTTVRLTPAAAGLSQPEPLRDSGSGVTVASDVVPGSYIVSVSSIPPGWYLRSIFVDDMAALDRPAMISAPGSTITVNLSQVATRLEGGVVDSRSQSVAGATVLIIPASMPNGIVMPNRVRETRTTSGGVFVAEGLPPGDYLVAAVNDAAADAWQDPKVLGQLRTMATRVRLGEDIVQAIQVTLGTIKK